MNMMAPEEEPVKDGLKPQAPGLVLSDPSPQEAADLLREGLRRGRFNAIACGCTVDYEGRSSSKLSWGERLVLVKRDGSLLIHRPTGLEPVNWQPPGAIFDVKVKGGRLIVTGNRISPRERVVIEADRISMVASLEMGDPGEFSMTMTEEELREAVLENPSLVEEGFKPISSELEEPTGFMDVVGRDRHGRMAVVELKRAVASREAAHQLLRYVEPLRRSNKGLRGILAAPGFARGVKRLLHESGLEYVTINLAKAREELRKARGERLLDYVSKRS